MVVMELEQKVGMVMATTATVPWDSHTNYPLNYNKPKK